jgi:hypothetical protein
VTVGLKRNKKKEMSDLSERLKERRIRFHNTIMALIYGWQY